MAVASKSPVSARARQVPSKARADDALNPRVIPLPLKAKGLSSRDRPRSQTVPILPTSQSAPMWLLRLCYLQRRSSVVTFVLVAITLTLYGWTVYSQKMWGQAYRKLENLQRYERQLTTTSEVLKDHMAQEAEKPAMGLVPSNPASTIFLKPAPERPAPTANPVLPATKPAAQIKQLPPIPLGY